MSQNTSIEWTEATWNPTRGCSRVSEGCRNCYAEREANRHRDGRYRGFVQITNGHPQWTGKVELIESKLTEPLHWKKTRRIFVNSMSDLFHEGLPQSSIAQVFRVMLRANWHTYQVLTKRSERLIEMSHWLIEKFGPMPHVWIGVSVESRVTKSRIFDLQESSNGFGVKFISIEPLIEDIGGLDLKGIDWVIVGGESGPGARPFDVAWARSVVQQCNNAGVACFVKQLGSNPTDPGIGYWPNQGHATWPSLSDRKGGNPDEWPEDLRVRQFPGGDLQTNRPGPA